MKTDEERAAYRHDYYLRNKLKASAQRKAWRAKNKQRKLEADRAYRLKTAVSYASSMSRFLSYRSGAVKRGYEFSLQFEEFRRIVNSKCAYCGLYSDKVGIDRVDNSVGYVITNIVPACGTCNFMKGRLTVEQFLHQCSLISATRKG